MKGGFEELNAKLEAATVGLAGISRKRVFGRNTFFVDGKLFALVWREGRIGLKLPNGAAHDELSQLPGATPWVAWGRPMTGWVLVPMNMHHDARLLATWTERACEAVRAAAPSPANETVAARLEPIPGMARVPKIQTTPPRVPSAAPPRVPSAAPRMASGAPRVPSAMPIPVPPKIPTVPPPGEGFADDGGAEFSFDDAEAAAPAAPVEAEPALAAPAEPVMAEVPRAPSAAPPAPMPRESMSPTIEVVGEISEEEAFSFDSPEPEAPGAASEAAEFDFGGGEPAPAPEAAAPAEPAGKKKKGKGRKKAG